MEPKNVEAEVLTEEILTERRELVAQSQQQPEQPQTRGGPSVFTDEWKYWIWDNIKRGVPKEQIFQILRKEGYPKEAIGKEVGWMPEEEESLDSVSETPSGKTQAQSTKKEQPRGKQQPHPQQQQAQGEAPSIPVNEILSLRDSQLGREKYIYGAEKVNNNGLDLYTIDDFLSEEECEKLVGLISANLEPSKVTMDKEGNVGHNRYESVRSSSTCHFAHHGSDVIDEIDDKICSALGIHQKFAEPTQGQHYKKGEEFKDHTDTFMPNSEEYTNNCAVSGQRTWTFMVFLKEPEDGGETAFPKLDKSFKPKVGQAVVWNNLYLGGQPNPMAEHAGRPILKGEKVIITKWFRQNWYSQGEQEWPAKEAKKEDEKEVKKVTKKKAAKKPTKKAAKKPTKKAAKKS